MAKKNIKFEVISEDAAPSELLIDYWKFGEKRTFALTIKNMLEKHSIPTPSLLEKKVSQIGFIEVSRLKDCEKCNDIHKFYVRSNFTYYLDKIKSLDNTCIKCNNENKIKYVKDTFEYYTNNYIPSQPKSIKNKELSYLEKIYLYILIENYIRSLGKVKKWYSLNALSGYACDAVLGSLVNKGFIFNHDSQLELFLRQAALEVLYKVNRDIFDSSLSEEIFNFLQLNFDHHTEIVIPSQFESIDDWFVELFNEIKEYKIKLNDIKDIENFLLNMRISEIYALSKFVCESNKIPLQKDNALEFEFFRVVNKYSLEQIHSIFYYQAIYTTSILYKMSTSDNSYNSIRKDKIFTKNIGYFITRIDQKSPDQQYSKALPLSWENSEFEQFVSAHIIGSAEKWDRLTPQQILSRWLDAVEYDFEG